MYYIKSSICYSKYAISYVSKIISDVEIYSWAKQDQLYNFHRASLVGSTYSSMIRQISITYYLEPCRGADRYTNRLAEVCGYSSGFGLSAPSLLVAQGYDGMYNMRYSGDSHPLCAVWMN